MSPPRSPSGWGTAGERVLRGTCRSTRGQTDGPVSPTAAALTSDVDVGVGHEQHGQWVHLGGVPHEHPTVGLHRHEVGQPAAVQLGRLPAEGTAVSPAGSVTCVGGSEGVLRTTSRSPPAHGDTHMITHLLMVDLWSRTVPAFVRYA